MPRGWRTEVKRKSEGKWEVVGGEKGVGGCQMGERKGKRERRGGNVGGGKGRQVKMERWEQTQGPAKAGKPWGRGIEGWRGVTLQVTVSSRSI